MMRLLFVACLAFVAACPLDGQEIAPTWETKLPFLPTKLRSHGPSGAVYLASTTKTICALRGSDGTVLWSYGFLERFGVEAFEHQYWNKRQGVLLLANDDRKTGPSEKIFIDVLTGEELWRFDKPLEIDDYALAASFDQAHVDDLKAFPVYDGQRLQMTDVRTGQVLWSNESYSGAGKIQLYRNGRKIAVVVMPTDGKPRTEYLDALSGRLLDVSAGADGIRRKIAPFLVSFRDQPAEIEACYPNKENSPGGSQRLVTVVARHADSKDTLWFVQLETEIVGGISGQNSTSFGFGPMFAGGGPLSISPGIPVGTFDDDRDESVEDDQLEFRLFGPYLVIITNRLTVIDTRRGSEIWSTEYKNNQSNVFPKKELFSGMSTVIGDNRHLYLFDLKTQTIKKIAIATGKVVWQTAKLGYSEIVPKMELKNGQLIVQMGGRVTYQSEMKSGGPPGRVFGAGLPFAILVSMNKTRYQFEFRFKGTHHGIQAFDSETGKPLWTAPLEKRPRIARVAFQGDQLYVATKEHMYILKSADGSIIRQSNSKELGIGDIFDMELDSVSGRVYLHGEKGLAAMSSMDLRKLYATVLDKNVGHMTLDKNFFIWTGKNFTEHNRLLAFDLESGKHGPSFEFPETVLSTDTYLTSDGLAVFLRKERRILRYDLKM
jgi:outer membrane protein assembly factor BamB